MATAQNVISADAPGVVSDESRGNEKRPDPSGDHVEDATMSSVEEWSARS